LDWLKGANQRGELAAAMLARLKNINAIHRAIRSGDPLGLVKADLGALPPHDRAALLRQFVGHMDTSRVESVNQFLGNCRDAWPGAFAPDEPRLRDLADALAESSVLVAARHTPVIWWRTLRSILEHLELEGPGGQGFEPGSLAAELVGATSELIGGES